MQPAENLKKYIHAFEEKLASVVLDNISPKPYCKRYLTHLLTHAKYYLHIYADVLDKLLAHSTKQKESISIIDYGAGNGLLGIFAKFCGFSKVVLNDIDPKFIHAAQKLSLQLNIEIDGFVTGDIGELQSYYKNDIPDAIVGTDVIEHIYSLERFLTGIQGINPSIVSVFTTASNPENYFKVKSLQKIQIRDELAGGDPGDHVLFGESPLEPFLKIRETIIQQEYNDLPDKEVMILAKATRGLNKQDILAAVKQYRDSGILPVAPTDANTCNPLNGSWTERILPVNTYISLYKSVGFTCRIYAGFYNQYEGGIRSFVKKFLNALVHSFGKKISPYIVIVGF